jgi:hypothetical protein
VEGGNRRLFQYLGTIGRPRQIAFLTSHGQAVYDFRSQRARARDGAAWQRPGDLSDPDRAEFLELVRTWERMMAARRAPQTPLAPGDNSLP